MKKFWLLLFTACGQTTVQQPQAEPLGAITLPPYNRDEWGRWIDADKDCQDTRQEVLIAESVIPVVFDEKKCRVLSGQWLCPYTGKTFTNPSDLQIDHVVALEEAHQAGGWAWTSEQKKAYFNDLNNPDHLVAASSSANQSKGSRPPDEWLPPDLTKRCVYLKARIGVLERYDLSFSCGLYAELLTQNCK